VKALSWKLCYNLSVDGVDGFIDTEEGHTVTELLLPRHCANLKPYLKSKTHPRLKDIK
jgi:hypothetical protein